MTIVAGFDVHRVQITFDALDQEVRRLGAELGRGLFESSRSISLLCRDRAIAATD